MHREIYEEWGSVEVADRYERLHRIGEGAFGEVRLGRCRRTGRSVALKAVNLPVSSTGLPKAVFREMESLRQLSHPNVVSLLDVYPQDTNLILVLEHAYTDLGSIITHSKTYLDNQFIRLMSMMMLKGLNHCHGAGIIHRDIKPANILITRSGVAKLGDFGLARLYDAESDRSLSHQVSTRWYRAPELLFASRHYTPAVDVWSAGVVIAELISLCPLFPGVNDIDQMFRVFQVMGTATDENWPNAGCLPDFSKVSFPAMDPVPLRALVPNCQAVDIEFIEYMLKLCPEQRFTCAQLLELDYFKDYLFTQYPEDTFDIHGMLDEHQHAVEEKKMKKKRSAKGKNEDIFDISKLLVG